MFKKSIPLFLLAATFAYAQETRPTTKPVEVPTRISVSIENETIEDALADFSKAAKVSVQLSNQNNRRRGVVVGGIPLNVPGAGAGAATITLKSENQPVLKVLADLLQQAQLTPTYNDNQSISTSLMPQKSLRIEVIDDRMLLILQSVSLSAYANTQGGQGNYNYNFQGLIFFDPAMKIVSTAQRSEVTKLVAGDALLSDQNQFGGNSQLQHVDGRALAVHQFLVQLQTNKRLKEIPSMTVQLGAYQIAEECEAQITNADLLNGGQNESNGLRVSVPPADPNGQNGITFSFSGKIVPQLRNQYPWNQYLTTFVRVEGPDGPVPGIALNQSGGGEETVTYRLQRRQGSITSDEIETIAVHLPTKLKLINFPITLNDMPLP